MENFMNLKPKDIKLLKEQVKKLYDSVDGDEPTEEEVAMYADLIDFFKDIAEDLKIKLYDITGYISDDNMEEAEEAKEEKEVEELK